MPHARLHPARAEAQVNPARHASAATRSLADEPGVLARQGPPAPLQDRLADSPRALRQHQQLQGVVHSPAMAAQRRRLGPLQGQGGGAVVQRLAVHGTAWGDVEEIVASAAGAGGVLFMSDGSSKRLAVKPGVPADEELAAAHAHGAVAGHGGFNKWEVKALTTRMAVANDVAGIRVAKQRVERAQGPLDARATGLINQVAADTTMIQDAAPGGSASITDGMTEQSPANHLVPGASRTGSNKDKVKSSSPLKPLMDDDTNFARSLGRIAATDLLLGNFDRLVDAANLENMLLNKNRKHIYPIDNTGGTAVARLLAGGGGAVPQAGWTGHRLVALFTAGNYAAIADDVWAIGGGPATLTVADDLLTGFVGPVGARAYNVLPAEQAQVRVKLQAHVQHIKAAFVAGLQAGRNELVAAGAPPVGSISAAAQQQYAARLAVI